MGSPGDFNWRRIVEISNEWRAIVNIYSSSEQSSATTRLINKNNKSMIDAHAKLMEKKKFKKQLIDV